MIIFNYYPCYRAPCKGHDRIKVLYVSLVATAVATRTTLLYGRRRTNRLRPRSYCFFLYLSTWSTGGEARLEPSLAAAA